MANFTKASNANIWAKPGGCRAHGKLTALYPSPYEEHPRTLEGRAAHELAEILINCTSKGGLGEAPGREIIGTVWGKDKQTMTEEMYEAAETYAAIVSTKMIEIGCFTPQVEKKLSIYGGNGYIDCLLIDPLKNDIYIYDFKFGRGPVAVEENYQLLVYAIAVSNELGFCNDIYLNIVQPPVNGEKVLTWKLDFFTLLGYAASIEAAANEAKSENPTAITGSHCRYCSARYACKAFKDATEWAIEFSTLALHNDVDILATVDDYERLQDAERCIKYALDAAKSRLINKIKSGESVPGYQFATKPGRLEWVNMQDAILEATMCGIDIAKPLEAITPTQAKKLGLNVDSLAVRAEGSIELKKINVKEIFKDVK